MVRGGCQQPGSGLKGATHTDVVSCLSTVSCNYLCIVTLLYILCLYCISVDVLRLNHDV